MSSGPRGLQVRGLRRGASGKQPNSFSASESLRSSSNRDLFPSGGTNPSSRIIPQKPNLKYQQQFQNQQSNYRDKVQIEGSNAFSSSRNGGTGIGEVSKFRSSSSSSSLTSSSQQQDFVIEPSPIKSKPKSATTSSSETSKLKKIISDNELANSEISMPPPIEQRLTSPVQQKTSTSTQGLMNQSDLSTSLPTHSRVLQSNSETIIIHVCDEARGVNRDFPCDRKTLLAEMRYFRAYLANDDGTRKGEDVDISVHCDVNIFEWLVGFMQAPNTPPVLDTTSVVSILISAEFLEMEKLVNHCLNFMAAQLEEIIKMPIDLSCIPERLVQKLADRVDATMLGGLRDKRDKLLSKLYKRRLELDFRNPPLDARRGGGMSKICCCKWCGRLFHFASSSLVMCDRAPVSVDFRGNIVARHRTLNEWSLTECVSRLHRNGMSWGDIYWLLWGVSHVFYCTITRTAFPASELSRRRIHPLPPTMTQDGNPYHACCDTPKLHFDVVGSGHGCSICDGCSFADHHVDDDRGAVCFIGPVRRLYNNEQRIEQKSEVDGDQVKSPSVKPLTPNGVPSPSHKHSSPSQSPSNAGLPPSSSSSPRTDVNGFITARRLLECQRDQLVASCQHPAMLQEIVGVLRGRAAESLLLRPPSPDSAKSGEGESSTDKNNSTDKSTSQDPSSNKRPNTPQRSRKTSSSTNSSSLLSKVKGSNPSRKGMTPEELAAERLEVQHMVDDLDSLGGRNEHAVFRSIPPSDDSCTDQDENRILQPQEHPFSLLPDDCIRDLEMISTLYNNNKLTQAKKQVWEVDLIREQDSKRMVLLSRLAHQNRVPLPPPPPELISKSSSSGNGPLNRKKERDSTQMSKRWR